MGGEKDNGGAREFKTEQEGCVYKVGIVRASLHPSVGQVDRDIRIVLRPNLN